MDNGDKFDSLDDILPTKTPHGEEEPSAVRRAIMKPQIQNICNDCHSTCSTCNSSNSETNCLACQAGLEFIAKGPAPNTTGVCVSPAGKENDTFLHKFNSAVVLLTMVILLALLVVVGIVLRLTTTSKSKLRDSYTYNRVEDTGLLSEYDDNVMDDAFLTYKQLKSKFKDMPTDDDDEEEEDAANKV